MKPRFSNQRNHALTLVDVLLIICVVAVLATMFLSSFFALKQKASRVNCVGNLRLIDRTFQMWAGSHGDKYPMQISVTNGGAMELIAAGNVAACFQVMSNELGTPKVLICPAGTDKIAATNLTTDFSNRKISYFVGLGLDANTNSPQVFLSGDDNFAIDGVPVKSGLLEFSTNVSVTWTTTRHKFGGNIGFVDGNVQGMSTETLQEALQKNGGFTNRLAIP
jgi:prepilin-type processing-associated H-X9-DG protein